MTRLCVITGGPSPTEGETPWLAAATEVQAEE